MGVPRLFPWIVKNFKNAVKHFQQGDFSMKIDNLYLDSNGLLHEAAQLVFNYGANKRRMNDYGHLSSLEKRTKTFEVFFNMIRTVTKIMIPTKTLYIAIDGPAPLAKQAQQRERRFVAMLGSAAPEDIEIPGFSSNEISPGTIFEFELTKYMHTAIRNEINTNPIWKNVEVIFSPPNVPGEGEHKCLEHIRSLGQDRKNDSNCIFGPDGDLIMLSLSSHIPNMFLFRQDQFNPGYYDLLDFGKIREKMNSTIFEKPLDRSVNEISDDFILIGFFVGNDFLPKIQMFMYLEDGLELMISTYRKIATSSKKFLTDNGKISHDSFVRFIEELARREDIYILDQHLKVPEDPRFKDETLLRCITKEKSGAPRLNMIKYREEYYKRSEIIIKPDDNGDDDIESAQKIETMCLDYLKMIAWVFQYYIIELPSWHNYYPWHYAPLMSDLVQTMRNLKASDISKLYSFPEKGEPSLPFVQLLSILPPSSSHLLPSVLGKLMKDPKSKLVKEGIYPLSFKIDLEGKTKEHMGVALLPFADTKLIKKVYGSVPLKKFTRNEFGKNEKFVYDETYTSKYTSDYGNIEKNHVRKIV
jgi:5'-3' exonuclease